MHRSPARTERLVRHDSKRRPEAPTEVTLRCRRRQRRRRGRSREDYSNYARIPPEGDTVAYYVCRQCGAPLRLAYWMRFDARRRPRFDTPQVMCCPYCGAHRGPLSERRVRLDLWQSLLRWAIVTASIFLFYLGYALWGGVPFWTGWLADRKSVV